MFAGFYFSVNEAVFRSHLYPEVFLFGVSIFKWRSEHTALRSTSTLATKRTLTCSSYTLTAIWLKQSEVQVATVWPFQPLQSKNIHIIAQSALLVHFQLPYNAETCQSNSMRSARKRPSAEEHGEYSKCAFSVVTAQLICSIITQAKELPNSRLVWKSLCWTLQTGCSGIWSVCCLFNASLDWIFNPSMVKWKFWQDLRLFKNDWVNHSQSYFAKTKNLWFFFLFLHCHSCLCKAKYLKRSFSCCARR